MTSYKLPSLFSRTGFCFLVCIVAFLVTCLLWFAADKNACSGTEPEKPLHLALKRQYITCTVNVRGGLGNQIWRAASLYGIGRTLGREPYFESPSKLSPEISEAFPNLHDMVHIKASPKSTYIVDFSRDCCAVDDVERLRQYASKYLKLRGDYLQNYRYFEAYKPEIRSLLECGPVVMAQVEKHAVAQDTNHLFCVHVRRTDFIKDKQLESQEVFVTPAMNYVFNRLQQQHRRISLTFFGDDYDFTTALNYSHLPFDVVYPPEHRSREVDMCLARAHCDSLLMTASGSTFAWWMAYLGHPNIQVFYNAQVSKFGNFSKEVNDIDYFPAEWTMLAVGDDGIAKHETRWWRERQGTTASL